jgi:hypothetical protein
MNSSHVAGIRKKSFENTGSREKWVISTGNLDNLVIERFALYCGFQMAR